MMSPEQKRRALDLIKGGATFGEAAAEMGVSRSTISGLCWRAAVKAPPRTDRKAKAHSARMKARHADPEFAKAHSARMKALHADPEFAKANSARMKARHARDVVRLARLPLLKSNVAAAAALLSAGLSKDEAADELAFRFSKADAR